MYTALSKLMYPDYASTSRRSSSANQLILLLLCLLSTGVEADLNSYTLFAPLRENDSYLVDTAGRPVHRWEHENATSTSTYLLPDGSLLRTAASPGADFRANGQGGRIERLDWNGDLIWEFNYLSDVAQLHHDIEPMPNGNVLMISWRVMSKADAVAAGRNPDNMTDDELWPDSIIEVRPSGPDSGEIVWQWNVWDHLVQDFDPDKPNYGVVADHPGRIDVNYLGLGNGGADWNHANALNYNPELDQVMISILTFCEIWVIDHSTTTQEAASDSGGRSGKGGDLIFRWGNPEAYGRGTLADRRLFGQHDPEWIRPGYEGAGNILVFNNGRTRPQGNWSTVEELLTKPDASGNYPMDAAGRFLPETSKLVYQAEVPESFFAPNTSGAQRLRNGNTLITNGPAGDFFEVSPEGEIIRWFDSQLVTQSSSLLFRAEDYILSSLPPGGMVLDGSISGSWFNSERDGEGWVIEVLENGTVFLVWFTYPPRPTTMQVQDWVVGLGYIENDHIVIPELETLRGSRFGTAFDADKIVREPWGRIEIVFEDCNKGQLSYSGRGDYGSGSMPVSRLSQIDTLDCLFPPAPGALFSDTSDMDLEEGDGSTSLAERAVSGSFFQPQRDGEGWLMENLGNGQALAYWFTFNPQGEAAWLLAVGDIGDNDIQFDDVLLFTGTRFGPAFDAADVMFQHWGTLNLQFGDCDSGSVSYNADDPAWGSGQINVIRLTSIAGTQCEPGLQ